MNVCYIMWRDAVVDANDEGEPPQAKTAILHEVGWLLDENEEAVLIGMEFHEEDEVQTGRWRLSIPKINILEMRVVAVGKAFPKRKTTKSTVIV